MSPRVLIIETAGSSEGSLASWLERHGCQVHQVYDPIDAQNVFRDQDVDVVVAVLTRCSRDCLTRLRSVRELSQKTALILLTRPQDIRLSIEGMKLGALDALALPVDMDLLLERVMYASSHRKHAAATGTEGPGEIGRRSIQSLARFMESVGLKRVRAWLGKASFP